MTAHQHENDEEIQLSFWDRVLLYRASRLYEAGKYENAEILFAHLENRQPEIHDNLAVFRFFCQKVAQVPPLIPDVLSTARRAAAWLWLSVLYLAILALLGSFTAWLPAVVIIGIICVIHRVFRDSRADELRIRCKHCGHFTGYIFPNQGMGWLGTNNCWHCGRSYPMPSIQWDTEWGLQYMAERGSAPEKEFFEEYQSITQWLRSKRSEAGT